jgi:hypothetical protein
MAGTDVAGVGRAMVWAAGLLGAADAATEAGDDMMIVVWTTVSIVRMVVSPAFSAAPGFAEVADVAVGALETTYGVEMGVGDGLTAGLTAADVAGEDIATLADDGVDTGTVFTAGAEVGEEAAVVGDMIIGTMLSMAAAAAAADEAASALGLEATGGGWASLLFPPTRGNVVDMTPKGFAVEGGGVAGFDVGVVVDGAALGDSVMYSQDSMSV